jgi:putative ABC transport system substrate-binding protein
MTKKVPTAIRWFRSDNRKSKIQNRKLAGAVAIAFAICGDVAEAQQPKKVPRLGYLATDTGSRASLNAEALRQGLKELSYVDGQNIAIEFLSAEGNLDRLPALAAELVRRKVDIIFAAGASMAVAAKKGTSTIPIIFVGTPDPVATGLVASLAQPGDNITGFSIGAPGLYGKRLEILKETLPRLSRVGVLLNPANSSSDVILKESRRRWTGSGRAGSISRDAQSQRYRPRVRGGNQGTSWRSNCCEPGTYH